MIEADATLRITAATDDEIDAIYQAVNALARDWPATPIVQITETRREAQA